MLATLLGSITRSAGWIAGLSLAALLALAGLYLVTTQAQIKALAAENARLSVEVEGLSRTLKGFEAKTTALADRIVAYTREVAQIRTETADALKVLEKHDLEKIGAAKPILLENRINKATETILRRLEAGSRP